MSFSTMASADLREELKCSICLNLYTDPISLQCEHNFCLDCIATVMDIQQEFGNYSCPECREQYPDCPLLEKNRMLCNIVECFRSANQEETEVLCTYCDSTVPASKSCLQCEASFCDKHLHNHSKLSHHILTEPAISFRDRKCSAHQETLKFYCTEDSACICISCWVAGDHRGHRVDLLNEASEKTKEKLRQSINTFKSMRQGVQKSIQNLESHMTHETLNATVSSQRVTELSGMVGTMLEDFGKRIVFEISRQEKQIIQSAFEMIQQLGQQQGELTRKINQLEELCSIQDPLTVLKKASNNDIKCMKADKINIFRHPGSLNFKIIWMMLQKGFWEHGEFLKTLMQNGQLSDMVKSDILLDINTAHDNLIISKKQNRVSHIDSSVNRPDGPKRFQCCQVLSIQSFTSGTHYWEVDVSKSNEWMIGLATESMERKIAGDDSFIGYNDKSWSLIQRTSGLQAGHKKIATNIDFTSLLRTVGIFLEYEDGRLSFYQLCDPVRHLHTFNTTFTEPLHAAFYVFPKCSVRIIK